MRRDIKLLAGTEAPYVNVFHTKYTGDCLLGALGEGAVQFVYDEADTRKITAYSAKDGRCLGTLRSPFAKHPRAIDLATLKNNHRLETANRGQKNSRMASNLENVKECVSHAKASTSIKNTSSGRAVCSAYSDQDVGASES